MKLSVLSSLGIVDCAILKRIDARHFTLEDYAGTWFLTLFPDSKLKETIDLDNSTIFLNDFLIDAESFWQTQQNGKIESGIWTEELDGQCLFLEAFASNVGKDQFLIIKNAEQTYYERKNTLQIARELSLSNNQVVERHDYLSQRLCAILQDSTDSNQRLPLHEAIRYAGIGIIIINDNAKVVESNPAAFDIFDHIAQTNQQQLLNTIEQLISRQYPEKKLFSGVKAWQGELFWHMPPLTTKWLNIHINPVFSSTGTVRHWIISISDQTRIKHLLQTNEELALHDPLTGLPNRQYFWQQLQSCIGQDDPFYLISIDVINFKYANDLYGYLEGDELLKQIARRLANELADEDFITRVGADEFMIIRKSNGATLSLKQRTFETDTYKFASELISTAAQAYFTRDGRPCDLPIKIGMTQYPQDATIAENLLNNANLALSYAKTTENIAFQVYKQKLNDVSARRLMLEEALKNAITNKEFTLYLQPIYNVHTNKIVKAEALIRWQMGTEQIMPSEFIPIAESSNIINAIGRWVFSQSCEIVSFLQDKNIHLPICVNFSPKQINDLNLISFIRKNIQEHCIDTRLLELEFTEGVLIKNYKKVKAFLHEIKQQGISISVDDFGTGYSSLAYLKHLPIDVIKIDRSFMQDVEHNEDDNAIVSAIIALAKKLKLRIIAEGIENTAQKDFLIANECSIAQGFLYNRPMPVDDFLKIILDNTKLEGKS